MHDRRGIRAARDGGSTIRGIAREFGASRNAVRRALDPDSSLDYERPSLAEEFEPAVHDVLTDYPRMTVEQVGELIEWPGSRRTLSDLVARVRGTVLDREREDLNRPRLGTVQTGRVTFGRVSVGRMIVGSVHVERDPDRTA